MTRAELREELRRNEGDPQIRERRRALQRRRAQEGAPAGLRRATVVIEDGGAHAAALEYTPAMDAPRVLARGAGAAARRIVDEARAAGVAVVRSAAAEALYRRGETGGRVPPDLYAAVADAVAAARRAAP